jgi:transposase
MSDVTATRRVMRKFTEGERAQIVAESLAPGAVVTEVARRHGVRPNLLSYWRALSRETGRTTKTAPVAAKLAQVQVTAAAPTPLATEGVIEIDLGNGCVRVRGIVAGAMLREVLAQLR